MYFAIVLDFTKKIDIEYIYCNQGSRIMEIGDVLLLKNCLYAPIYNGRTGTVTYIDKDGFMKGTWGRELINEDLDEIEKVGHKDVSKKALKLAEMSSKQAKAKQELENGLKEGIVHLLKIYFYKSNELYMKLYRKGWIGTVRRLIACETVDRKGKPFLTQKVIDSLLQKVSQTFDNHLARAESACEDYDCVIDPNDKLNAKEFVLSYLEWAFNELLQTSILDLAIVTSKIEKLLKINK